jgi:hypothetical protein
LDECSQLMLSDISVGERSGRVIVRSGKGNKARSNELIFNHFQLCHLTHILAKKFFREKVVGPASHQGRSLLPPERTNTEPLEQKLVTAVV